MEFITPKYIQIAGIQNNIIQYTWDDWNIEQAESPIDNKLFARLKKISQRAIVAFTISSAEWIIYRFGTLSNDPLPLQYLVSAWAQIVDFKYSFVLDIIDINGEWIGPVRGPIGLALTNVIFVIEQAEHEGDPALGAAWISKLAEHVITDPTPYQSWRERIMERLERLYLLDSEETLGEVVPREALDPDFNFRSQLTESLINHFLSSLDYNRIPFLNTPNQMLELAFEGIPYVFDIEKDRKNRFEW